MSLMRLGALSLLAAIGIAGIFLDICHRRLPNWLCAVCLVCGLGFGLLNGGTAWAAMSALHAVLALFVGIGLFALGAIGGGDAKYYAAMAAWVPLKFAILLLLVVASTGFALVVAWLLLRPRIAGGRGGGKSDPDFGKVPYGVAISVGGVASFAVAIASA